MNLIQQLEPAVGGTARSHLAGLLDDLRGRPGTRMTCIAEAVGRHLRVQLAEHPADDAALGEGRGVRTLDAPADLIPVLEAWRAECAEPGRGTWFLASISCDETGVVDVTADFEGDPMLFDGISPEEFAIDLERFPRDAAAVPAWLDSELEAGRAILARNRAASGSPSFVPPVVPLPRPTGSQGWWLSLLAWLPIPGLSYVIATVAAVCAYLSARRSRLPYTRNAFESLRIAANWNLTVVALLVLMVASSVALQTLLPRGPQTSTIVGLPLGLILPIGIAYLVHVVSGIRAAGRGEVFRSRLAVPFFRSAHPRPSAGRAALRS